MKALKPSTEYNKQELAQAVAEQKDTKKRRQRIKSYLSKLGVKFTGNSDMALETIDFAIDGDLRNLCA